MIVGTEKHSNEIRKYAERDSAEMTISGWDLEIIPDTSATLVDLQKGRIFLYGKPDENRIVAEVQEKFPYRFTGDSLVINQEVIMDSTLSFLQVIDNPFIQHGLLVWIAHFSPASVGVICRYRESIGWYEYNVSADGMYNVLIGRWLTEGIADYTPILSDESEYLKPNDAAIEIGMDCVANTLFLYVDGKLIRKIDVTRYGLTGGKVGLAVSSFDDSSTNVAVDWVKVSGAPSP